MDEGEIRRSLFALVEKLEDSLADFAGEHLRIANKKGNLQYYLVCPGNAGERYLKKEETYIAKRVAQQDYERAVLREAKALLKKRNLENWEDRLREVYEKQSPYRKELISPCAFPGTFSVAAWMEKSIGGLNESEAFLTVRGEYVCTKSEKVIADYLYGKEIPYKYMRPLLLAGAVLCPHFTLLDVRHEREIYWEHYRDSENIADTRRVMAHMEIYEQNNIAQGEQVLFSFDHDINSSKMFEMNKKLSRILERD